MRILFLTQYYPPEIGAAQNRLSDVAERLAASGHSITVLTAMPNYPTGAIAESYKGKWLAKENLNEVHVVRTWVYATKSKLFLNRLLNYFSFAITSVVGALMCVKSQDVIFVEAPPLFLGISGLIISWLWGAKLVFNVSDLWPQSAVDMGVLRNKTLIRLSTLLEEFIYNRSDLVTGQTQGIVSNIQSRAHRPVFLFTNGCDVSSVVSGIYDRGVMRRRLGYAEDAFLVGYAGLHGLAQSLESVLVAARMMSGDEEVQFAFFGDGPEKLNLQQIARNEGLKNVRFFPPEPRASMSEIMNAWDASLVPLRSLELFKGALPSKLFESMGAGLPIILAVEGEAKDLLQRSEGGICVPPENPVALEEAITFLKEHPGVRRAMGSSGRRFIAANYDRRAIAEKLEQALVGLFSQSPAQTATNALGES